MRLRVLILFTALASLLQAGCAADFRAGGERRGVEAGAAIGPIDPLYTSPPRY